jgi:hypothetical protein
LPSATDSARIDQVIQYALASSSHRLGAIHLVKYVYLADLRYAETHAGETYTGVPWVFLHFGPWASEVQSRVDPAAEAVGAEKIPFRTPKAEGEFYRYRLGDQRRADALASVLPWEATTAVRWALEEHGGDTPSLLRHVYLTGPMLRAVPRERLEFAPAATVAAPSLDPSSASSPSSAEKRRAAAAVKARREEFQRRLKDQRDRGERLAPADPPPRYDDAFFEGTAALDRLAGEPLKSFEGDAVLDPRVWRSPTRSEPDG